MSNINNMNINGINLIDLSDMMIKDSQDYVIFGVGCAGIAISWYFKTFYKSNKYIFCDNNVSKQDDKADTPIYSVEETLSNNNVIYLIGFMDNTNSKLESAVECLNVNGVKNDRIILVNMKSGWFDDACIAYTREYIQTIFVNGNNREHIKKVEKVCFLANGFSKEVENKTSGGSIGAICMQKRYLGYKYRDVIIEYPYYQYSSKPDMVFNKYWYITGSIDTVKEIVKNENNTIYISNDLFSAYALYLLGKEYSFIFHGQGDIVQEWTLWGRELTDREKAMIHEIEYITIANACNVSFPSVGAKWYFKQSLPKSVDFNGGLPLYNTIYDFPNMKKIDSVQKDDTKVTFLSIGQFTWLKGMDRIPDFLEQYINYTGNSVRWIVVADGVLKKDVSNKAKQLEQNGKLEFINIDYKISHAEIFYLLDISNIYLMLHRVSIFDFSTLEAMYCEKAVILSDISGNDEYNIENNIMLVKDDIDWAAVSNYIDNYKDYGIQNKRIYDHYFSDTVFIERYHNFIDSFLTSVETKELL